VYGFLYLPIVVLVVFAFNSSRQNVVFEGIVNRDPCGPFYWFCQLFQNQERWTPVNTLKIAITSPCRHDHWYHGSPSFAAPSLQVEIVCRNVAVYSHRNPRDRDGHRHTGAFNACLNLSIPPLTCPRSGWVRLGTVIISHVAFSVPSVRDEAHTLASFDHAVESRADLGANEWTTFAA
jgi:hypothetical protein